MALGKYTSSYLWIVDLDSAMTHLSLYAASYGVSN